MRKVVEQIEDIGTKLRGTKLTTTEYNDIKKALTYFDNNVLGPMSHNLKPDKYCVVFHHGQHSIQKEYDNEEQFNCDMNNFHGLRAPIVIDQPHQKVYLYSIDRVTIKK